MKSDYETAYLLLYPYATKAKQDVVHHPHNGNGWSEDQLKI